jgi:hypothetical protein
VDNNNRSQETKTPLLDDPVNSVSSPNSDISKQVQEPTSPPIISNELPKDSGSKRKVPKKAFIVLAILLVLLIIGGIAHHNKKNKPKVATATNSSAIHPAQNTSDSSNIQNIRNDLDSANSSYTTSSQNLSNASSSLNDQSTLTKAP